MASFNRVILMGNLTRDPELRQAASGAYVAKTSLAVNERIPDGQGGWREETSFVDIVVFGRRAEAFGKWLRKGRPCLVEGRLRQSRWEDKESGQKRSKVEVVVDNWEFVGGREGGGGSGAGAGDSAEPGAAASAASAAEAAPNFPAADDFIPDDVPF